MTTIAQALQSATAMLATASPTPRLDAEVLLSHVLGVGRVTLLTESGQELRSDQEAVFDALIRRRAEQEPVAYITGHKEFYGLDFVVNRRVLVPRPETELLVDLALKWCKQHPRPALTIADIGTGSGCIAITLAVHLPAARVWAVDLSADALDLARENATWHQVTDRLTLLQGDGFKPLPQPVDLIVSNPPYTILDEVDANVYRWEPHLALDGGAMQGFAIPHRLLQEMPPYLQPGGAALIEIGAWQGTLALQTAQAIFPHADCTIHKDLAGHDRVLMIQTMNNEQ